MRRRSVRSRPRPTFARTIDLRDFAFDPAFRGVAMIDFFLARLGLDPARVPAGLRRNAWLAPRLRPAPAARGYVLVCPRTSMALRDMPAALHADLLHWLAAHAGAPGADAGHAGRGHARRPAGRGFRGAVRAGRRRGAAGVGGHRDGASGRRLCGADAGAVHHASPGMADARLPALPRAALPAPRPAGGAGIRPLPGRRGGGAGGMAGAGGAAAGAGNLIKETCLN